MVSLESNKTLVRRWYDEFVNEHDVDVLDNLLAPGFASHFLSDAPGRTRDELKEIDGRMFASFPDLRIAVDDMVAEGDRVAVRYSSQGTHRGDALGVPATGQAAEGTGMDFFRIADGKLAERWAELDFTGLLVQIGAVPG
ncbi:MAG: ester cyclase [Chloroflexota bacterium]|nr:ester cyclase [Chloroflexota bacterium]